MNNIKDNDNTNDNSNVIEFISSLPKMVSVFPEPEPSLKNVPQWYKEQLSYFNNDKTPENGFQNITVKKCMAISDVLLMGYILKAPCDVYIDTTDGTTLKYDLPGNLPFSKPMFGGHAQLQYDKMPIDKDFYVRDLLRLNMVWLVKTKPGYSCLFINPMLGDESPLMSVPGVIDTDEFLNTGLFSFFVKKNYKGIIKKGTPLIQVIPFKRESWGKTLESVEKAENIFSTQGLKLRSVFSNGYKNFFRSKKEYR
jgi:hypothetical protein